MQHTDLEGFEAFLEDAAPEVGDSLPTDHHRLVGGEDGVFGVEVRHPCGVILLDRLLEVVEVVADLSGNSYRAERRNLVIS